MRSTVFTSLLFLPLLASAWLPGEHKQIFSRDGIDLFNRSSLYAHGLTKRSPDFPKVGNNVKVSTLR